MMERIGLFALCCATILLGAKSPAAEPSPGQVLKESRLYLESGQHELAIDELSALLERDLPPRQREQTLYLLGRTQLAAGLEGDDPGDAEALEAGYKTLKRLREEFPHGRFHPDLLYWQARGLARRGELYLDGEASAAGEDSARQQAGRILREAAKLYRQVDGEVGRGELDLVNRLHHALLLGTMAFHAVPRTAGAEPGPAEVEALYAACTKTLRRVVLDYSDHPRRIEAEEELVRHHYLAGHYEQAIDVADRFAERLPDSERLPRILFYRAESLYYLRRNEEALTAYRTVLAAAEEAGEASLATEARYGMAWCHLSLASVGVVAEADTHRREAAAALRTVMNEFPDGDPRADAARYHYAQALLDAGKAEAAGEAIAPLVEVADYRLRARLLAGRAALERAEAGTSPAALGVASRHFRSVHEEAAEEGRTDLLLEALPALVRIELAAERPALAARYAAEVIRTAQEAHDPVALARGRIDLARALLALKQRPGGDPPSLVQFRAQGLWEMLVAAGYRPGALPVASRRLAASEAPDATLEAALLPLEAVRQGGSARVRTDEVSYYRGEILWAKAQSMVQRLTGTESAAPTGKEARALVSAYQAADKVLERAVNANPRGAFAGAASLARGRALLSAAQAYETLSAVFEQQGQPSRVPIYRTHARRAVQDASERLRSAVEMAPTPAGRLEARLALAQAYTRLDRVQEAEEVYREILATADIPAAVRERTTLRLSDLLAEDNRPRQAAVTLSRYYADAVSEARRFSSPLAEIALRLASYQTRLENLEEARAVLFELGRDPRMDDPDLRQYRIEALFRANELGLRLAAEATDAAELAEASVDGLLELSRSAPETEYALRAVLAAAAHRRDHGDAAGALAILRNADGRLTYPGAGKHLALEEAATLMQAGQFAGAREAFAAVLARLDEEEAALRAQALIGIAGSLSGQVRQAPTPGEASRLLEEAMRAYARVWARYPQLHRIADDARLAAAQLLLEMPAEAVTGNRNRQALTILEGMAEEGRAVALKQRIGEYMDRARLAREANEVPPFPEIYPE